MSWVVTLLFYFVGIVVASFTIIQILIMLCFAIPFTLSLHNQGILIKKRNIIFSDLASILLLCTIFALTYWGIWKFLPSGLMGFNLGCAWTLFLGIGKVGYNEANVSDYWKNNERYLISKDSCQKSRANLIDIEKETLLAETLAKEAQNFKGGSQKKPRLSMGDLAREGVAQLKAKSLQKESLQKTVKVILDHNNKVSPNDLNK